MPIRKLPQTFDQHLGSVVDGLAKGKGGRAFLATLTDWSEGTVERRVTGRTQFTVKELEIIAAALNTSAGDIIAQALRNYSDGSAQDGIEKLLEEEGLKPVSAAPISLDAQRKKKTPAEMTDDELEAERSAANTDPEHLEDEPDHT